MTGQPQSERAGRLVTVGTGPASYRAFVPKPLPPDPPLAYSAEVRRLNDAANIALGRLDGATSVLPDAMLFLYSYVQKEAVLSAQIEGTQSTLVDLLQFEVQPQSVPQFDEVREISNYVAAVYRCLDRMRNEDFAVSLRLIREAHEILLRSGRGQHRDPGEFRRSQNWIGGASPAGAVFVPPPAEQVMPCMDALEKFMHAETDVPLVVKTGLVHAQFETIHPFLDGNGRVGRMLITMMLFSEAVLQSAVLYSSLYLKQHRSEYYERLSAVRSDGDWEGWTEFYLRSVLEAAEQAGKTARRIAQLFEEHRELIRARSGRSANPLKLHALLARQPVVSAQVVAEKLAVSEPTARNTIAALAGLGLLGEMTGHARNRTYGYLPYISILAEGTLEPPG